MDLRLLPVVRFVSNDRTSGLLSPFFLSGELFGGSWRNSN